MINDKKSVERYQISKNVEEKVTEDTEVSKLRKLGSQKKKKILKKSWKFSDERYQMDMSDENKYYARDQMR